MPADLQKPYKEDAAVKRKAVLGTIVCVMICAGVTFSDTALAEAVYNGKDTIEISGTGNTLASIAGALGNPKIFSYDEKT